MRKEGEKLLESKALCVEYYFPYTWGLKNVFFLEKSEKRL